MKPFRLLIATTSLLPFLPFTANAQSSPIASENACPTPVFSLQAGFDSKYVTEGRDNLDGKSLFWATLEAGFEALNTGAWIGSSPGSNGYDEINLFASWENGFGPFIIGINYTYLEFLSDDSSDQEVGAAIRAEDLPLGLTLSFVWQYSFEAEGSFFETGLSSEFALTDRLTLSPFATFGWNDGFVSEGHNGPNHLALGLVASAPLGDHFELGAYLAYNIAIESNPGALAGDESLENFIYSGLSVKVSF